MTQPLQTPFFLKIDELKCQGHNRCYLICPELFDVDDFGIAMLLSKNPIPQNLMEKAQLAVQNCPEFAISVTDSSS
jgi:ferredoxin